MTSHAPLPRPPGRHALDPALRPLYGVFAASFAVVGLLFFLFPDGTIDALNAAGRPLGFPDAPHLGHRFWLGLGASYMAVVTTLALQIAAAPAERRTLMVPLAVGKTASSLTCALFLALERPYFIYLANALVDGGIALVVVATYRLTDPRRPAGLGRGERRILEAVAEAFLPPGGAFAAGAGDVGERGLAAAVEAHALTLGPLTASGLGVLLRWIDLQPVLFHPGRHGLRRLSRLPLARRAEVLEATEASRLLPRRQAAIALKTLLGVSAYGDPAIAAAAGYDRGWVDAKIREADARRAAGGKGPYPEVEAP